MVIFNAIYVVLMIMGLFTLLSSFGLLFNGNGTALGRDGSYKVDGAKARVLGAGHFLMGVISLFPGVGGILGLVDTRQIYWLYTALPFAILVLSWFIADRLPGTAVKQEMPKSSP